ncbi:hypothetical protein, partial [Undibacterium sp.]|uniref:hypothetical protein n=1 Tax=Undibacterium sp. TaxID=1914977 RepID=UPI003750FD29
MSALGSLVVKLALEYAEYTKGLDKSSQDSLKFAQNTQKHFDAAKDSVSDFFANATRGALGFLGVGSAIEMFNQSVEQLASLDDMSQKTGSSVENLSRLQKVAEMTGFEFGNVDASITKLAKNLGGFDEEGSGASKVLDALGISSKTADGNLRDTSEIVIDIANKLQDYNDDASKATVANELFGKSGADLLPYLNDVAENVEKFSGASTDAAQKASQLQDSFGALKVGAGELSTKVAVEMMPIMLEGFKALVVLGGNVAYVFKGIGKEIGGLAAQATQFASGNWEEAGRIGDMMKSEAEQGRKEFDAWEQSIMKIGTATDKVNEKVKSSLSTTMDQLDKVNEEYKKAAEDRKKRIASEEREHEVRIKQRSKFIENLEKEVAMLSLTAAQAKAYEAAQIGITGKQLDKVKALTKSVEAHAANEKAIANELKVSQEHAAQNLEFANTLDKNVDALKSQVETQLDYNNRLGMSKDAIRDLNNAEIERQAIARESMADVMDQIDVTGKLGDKYREEAKLIRELNSLKNKGIDKQEEIDKVNTALKEQTDIWASIDRTAHDTFVSVLDGSKDTAKRLRETFKNTFFDWLYQMTIKKWFINVGAGVSVSASGMAQAASDPFSPESVINAGKTMWESFSSGFSGFGDKIASFVQSGLDKAGLSMSGGATGSFASGVGTFASYGAGIAAGVYGGRAISNGYSVGDHGNALVNVGTIAGAFFGGPIGAAIGGVIAGGLNRAFGMREKELGGQTVTGTLGTDSLMRNQSWSQSGGWFRSDRSGVWSYGLKDSTAIQDGRAYVDSNSLNSDKALLELL